MKELKDALLENGYSGEEELQEKEIINEELSFTKLRDKLYSLGDVVFEDQNNHIYIVNIKSNILSNTVTIAIKWKAKKIYLCGYSSKGLIKSNSVQKQFKRIENVIISGSSPNKKSIKKPIVIAICSVIFVLLVIFSIRVITIKVATDDYNNAVNGFNKTVEEYNRIAVKGDIKAVSDLPESMETIELQSTDFLSMIGVSFSNNSGEKIRKDTDTVREITTDTENAIAIVNQLICPKQDFVIQKLKSIDSIKGIEAVTKENNPDELLNKDGGYYGCLYFTINLLDEKTIPGKSIVDKGTDAGGAIELYNSLDDAKKRCEYLASYDGTILTTGSYVLVGTMVIRTSFKLDDNEQYQLTDSIIKAITTI